MGIAAVLLIGMLLNAIANVLYLIRQRRSVNPSSWPSVAVFIPARNEADNIGRLLDSLLDQEYPDLQIHVYDDQSDDATPSILATYTDQRIHVRRGEGPPPGWMGKVHALHELTSGVTADVFLFLDADTELLSDAALKGILARYEASGADVATGVTRLAGGGLLLVSLIGSIILSSMPWWLGRHVPASSMAGVNGQCWLVRGATYKTHTPHTVVWNQVLEDIHIGRYFHRAGIRPVMLDVQHEVKVHMYADLASAWDGFRKNTYDIAGGSPISSMAAAVFYGALFLVMPILEPWLWVPLVLTKVVTDRFMAIPARITLLAPVSFVLGFFLQLDSAISHWRGTATWKGRIIAHPGWSSPGGNP